MMFLPYGSLKNDFVRDGYSELNALREESRRRRLCLMPANQRLKLPREQDDQDYE